MSKGKNVTNITHVATHTLKKRMIKIELKMHKNAHAGNIQ